MSTIHYKFKSNLDYQSVTFDGIHISLADLKKAISQQKRLKPGEYNLVITNAQSREVYKKEEDLIPKNTSVIVARIPMAATSTTNSTSKAWEKFKEDCAKAIKEEKEREMISLEQLKNTADLVNAPATEMDKIKAAINQSTRDFDPSNYKSKVPTGTPPTTYTCYKCGKQGHYITSCPLKDTDQPGVIEPRFKRSTGIPNSFLTLTDNPLQPGALLTHTGHFAVPTLDADAYRVGKKERPPFLPQPASEIKQPQQPQIPPALQCPLCKELLRDAVVTPCCGNSFCDECIRNALLETEDHECPICHETEVSPSRLIPNKFHRDKVREFINNKSYNQPPHTEPQPTMPQRHVPEINAPPSSRSPVYMSTPPPGTYPPSHPPPHQQVPHQVPPPTQPPPAMPLVEPRPPPQVAAMKTEPSGLDIMSMSPNDRPPTPTKDENSQSATDDEEKRGMAVQVVGTRIGNSIQLTGAGDDFDHGHSRGGYDRRDRDGKYERRDRYEGRRDRYEGRERNYDGRGDRNYSGRGDRNYERRDRNRRGDSNYNRHDRGDNFQKEPFKGNNFEPPPARDAPPNVTNPPPLIPPPVKAEPPPFNPFTGPPPSMSLPPPGFGPPPHHPIPPTTGPPPSVIPVVGSSQGGFPPIVFPPGVPPPFPPQIPHLPGRPLSEAEFYKEKARLLQESLPPTSMAPKPQRDMMDDFHKELMAYSQDQKRRRNAETKPRSKSRSRSKSRAKSRTRSRTRSRSRSRSKGKLKPRSRSRSRSRSRKRSRTRSRSTSRSRVRSRSRNRKLSRSRTRSPRLRSRTRSRSKSYARSPRSRLRSRTRSRSRSLRRSPRFRSRSRSPWLRSRSRSRSPRRPYTRSRSRSRSRPRYRSYSRSRSRSFSPRYGRSRSRSPYRRFKRSKSPMRPKSPIKSPMRRRERWSPPPVYRNFRNQEAPPPPPGEVGPPPPLLSMPFRRFSPDRFGGFPPYPDRGMPMPPQDTFYGGYEPHPYDDGFPPPPGPSGFRFGMGPTPPNFEPSSRYMGMHPDPRARSPRRRGGRSPGRAGRGRRDRNPDFRRNQHPGNQEFHDREEFDRGNMHPEFHRDENHHEGKQERRRDDDKKKRDEERKMRDRGKEKIKKEKKDGKDNKENADVKVKRESSSRKGRESSQKKSAEKEVKKVKKRPAKEGSDSDSATGQTKPKAGNLIQIKIESAIPEEENNGEEKKPLKKEGVSRKTDKTPKSDGEKPLKKKVSATKKEKDAKKSDKAIIPSTKSDTQKPKKVSSEKTASDPDNMPGKLRVKAKKKKPVQKVAAPEGSGVEGKSSLHPDQSEKRKKLKRTTPDIPEDIPDEDTESPAKRIRLESNELDTSEEKVALTKKDMVEERASVPVPEPSKWERDDYEPPTSPARKPRMSSEKKPLPKSVIESAEKVLSQKPVKPSSVASAVTAPLTQVKPQRRVYLDEEPMATEDVDRKVMNKQKSMEITISSQERGRERVEGRSRTERRDYADDRRLDRKTSSSTLWSDDERKGSRNGSTGSIKDRLGKRADVTKSYDKGGRAKGERQVGYDRSRSQEDHESDKGVKPEKVRDRVRSSRDSRDRSSRDSRDRRRHSSSRERTEPTSKSSDTKEVKSDKTKTIDRKESMIDEATFEPDYNEADSDSENVSASDDQARRENTAEGSVADSSEEEDEDDSSPSKRKNDEKKHKKSKHKKHKHKHKHKKHKKKHKKHKEGKEKE